MVDVFFIVFMQWFRSQQISSPLGCQRKLHIPLGVLPRLVLKEDKQSCVPEPHCNTHLPPASQDWTDISGGLTCMRRDQSFVLTWKALGAPGEVPGRAHKPNRIRRGLAWPRETIGTVSRKVAMGSASNDSTVGRFPSEQLPKMPPRYLGKRQRVHGAAEGPSALGLLQLLSHL